MSLWRIICIAALVLALIPTVVLMKRTEAPGRGRDQQARDRKKLNWCIRLLIVLFLLTLGITLYEHYSALFRMV